MSGPADTLPLSLSLLLRGTYQRSDCPALGAAVSSPHCCLWEQSARGDAVLSASAAGEEASTPPEGDTGRRGLLLAELWGALTLFRGSLRGLCLPVGSWYLPPSLSQVRPSAEAARELVSQTKIS